MEKTNGELGTYPRRFSGFISFAGPKPEGSFEDTYGPSVICAGKIVSDDEFSFRKLYRHGDELAFDYWLLKKGDGVWMGHWKKITESQEKGLVVCILIPNDTNLMNPIAIIEFLKTKGFPDSQIPLMECFTLRDALEKPTWNI